MRENRPTTEELLARQEAAHRRAQQAQVEILRMAVPQGVKVSFGEGRRAADVAMVLLKGERSAVLRLPAQLEESLGLDVHIVRSTFSGGSFELLLVFTEPLERQRVRSPERRAALRLQLEHLEREAERDGGAADLLDTGDDP